MASIVHNFVSAIADDNTPSGAVGPDEWNDEHIIVGETLSKVDDTNVTITLGGSPLTALLDPVSITLGWTGQLSVARGGTGVSSLSSLTANPTASVGLSAVNGSASTFMRSDGAPALSQAITPTWTGLHIWTRAVGSGASEVVGDFSASVAAGTSATVRALHAGVTTAGGTITTGVAIDIDRTRSSGTFTTAIGLRVNASSGTIGTDIAIQSLGGQNRFVGPANFGADATPANTTNGDVQALRLHVGTDAAFTTDSGITASLELNNGIFIIGGTLSSSTANYRAMLIAPTMNGSGTAVAGLHVVPILAPSASIANAFGFRATPSFSPGSTITITTATGLGMRNQYLDVAGAVTLGVAVHIQAPLIIGALKPTTQRGVYVENQGAAGITNAVGVQIDAQASATNNYDMGFGTVDTTAAGAYYGRVPVLYNGLKKYLHIFSA